MLGLGTLQYMLGLHVPSIDVGAGYNKGVVPEVGGAPAPAAEAVRSVDGAAIEAIESGDGFAVSVGEGSAQCHSGTQNHNQKSNQLSRHDAL